ncbi:hypothetical protein [Geodermatophilus marinus]|uniref:hypothetical protein n=1 Tax=Geodermatophilus sp. LHW52908 TaxID=2303986 RepID=UPI000E3EAA19|nr:hypothetical protein [Geodermatophilus sp. LHW52908]RFU19733.1 hypothetical protein D0Z06_19700 [Geodermatophilus sp. LHW52908]
MSEPPSWSWRPATAWATGVTGGLALLAVVSGEQVAAGLVAALSNGLLTLFLVAGVQAAATGQHRRWVVPASAAAATAVTVLALRLGASLAGVGGPIGDVPDTLLDVGWRTAVVLVVVALAERWRRPDRAG